MHFGIREAEVQPDVSRRVLVKSVAAGPERFLLEKGFRLF